MTGASLQMFTHGTITALLFVMVGLIYDRTHTRQIADLGGLAHIMPIAATVFVIAGLASLGPADDVRLRRRVPRLRRQHPALRGRRPIFAVFGILLSAGYVLWTVQRVFFGPNNERWDHLTDTTEWYEQVAMAGLVAVIIGVGIYPATIVDVLENGVRRTLGARAMLDDVSRIGPVLALALTAALILIWDMLPIGKPFPMARGRALMLFALAGPIGAAVWTALLLANDDATRCSPARPCWTTSAIFFFFLFAGIAAAIILASQDYGEALR